MKRIQLVKDKQFPVRLKTSFGTLKLTKKASIELEKELHEVNSKS